MAALAVALPLLFPLQSRSVCDAIVIDKAVGWVIVAEAVAIHPLLSVAVIVYVPALSLEALSLVPPLGVQF